MDDAGVKLLLEAAKAARINPGKLSVRNPWTCEGNVAMAMQSAVSMINPSMAAKWKSEAGHSDSLETAAVKAGLTAPTHQSNAERYETDPDFVVGMEEAQASFEARMLKKFDSEADKLKASRERQFKNYQNVGQGNNPRTGLAN
jgi:hypothetical protein